jgi:hypothetical protein
MFETGGKSSSLLFWVLPPAQPLRRWRRSFRLTSCRPLLTASLCAQLTTLLNHLTRGQPPLNMTAGTKVPPDYWGRSNGETEVLVADNELVTGVIDKAQFGKYGLVHAVQEVYGCALSGQLLSALSRLFTAFLQVRRAGIG